MSEHSLARVEAGAALRMPRPSAGAAAVLAAAAATLFGTAMLEGAATVAQVAAAAVVATLSVAVVPIAARKVRFEAYAAASAAAGAACIHFAVSAEHFDEWWGFGLFFVTCGVLQLLWAVLVVTSRSRRLIWLGVIGNAAVVVLWAVTRTAGTLVGPEPHTPEPVALADSVATALELAIVIAATRLLASPRRRPAPRSRLVWAVTCTTLTLTGIALLSILD